MSFFGIFSPLCAYKSPTKNAKRAPSSEKAYKLTTHYMLRGAASQKTPPAPFVYKKCSCFAQPSVAKSQKRISLLMFTFFCTFRLQVRKPISSRHTTCSVVTKKLAKNANIADTDLARIYTFSLK